MYPEINIFSATLSSYSVMVALGLLAAGIVKIVFPMPGVEPSHREFVFFPACLGLFVGAKIPVLLSYGLRPEFVTHGKSMLGALLGAYLAVRLAKWRKGMHWVGGGDAYVLPISIGLAFGRVGCLLNGCCWGRNGLPVPAFEIAFHLAAFCVFVVLRRRRLLAGRWFPLYMLSYCVFRFAMEFLRTEPRVFLGLTVYHLLAMAGILVFSWELLSRRPLQETVGYAGSHAQ